MDDKTETNDSIEAGLPSERITWTALYERAPYERGVHDDPSGGVVVHRCHPLGGIEDFFAFGFYHETMKGHEQKDVYLYSGAGEREQQVGLTRWNGAVSSYQIREGSYEDCDVCQGEVSEMDLINEVTEQIMDLDVARVSEDVVYIDNHGRTSSGETYDVKNRLGAWTHSSLDLSSLVASHPYVYVAGVETVGENDRWYSPSNTLRVTLGVDYPPNEGVIV